MTVPIPTVTVVDYGRGNLFSIRRAFEEIGAKVVLTDNPQTIAEAQRLVLPGVGAFGDAMAELGRRDLLPVLKAYAASRKPLLGICVGMQILFDVGEEFGEHDGLGLLPGRVSPIPDRDEAGRRLKIPHIGWNRLSIGSGAADPLLAGLGHDSQCYFVHSFAAQPGDLSNCLAETEYGGHRLTAAVRRDNVWGFQFHPEKSGPTGLSIVSKFSALEAG